MVCSHGARTFKTQPNDHVGGATLFLLSAKDPYFARALDSLSWSVRKAVPCHGRFFSGRWMRLCKVEPRPEFFVFVDETGGTGGPKVQVFHCEEFFIFPAPDTGMGWGLDFVCLLETQSRLPPYAGDIDSDGVPEILVATEETNLSCAGLPENPCAYRALKYDVGTRDLRQAAIVPYSDVLSQKTKFVRLDDYR